MRKLSCIRGALVAAPVPYARAPIPADATDRCPRPALGAPTPLPHESAPSSGTDPVL